MVRYLFILNIAIYVIWTTPSNAGSLISKPYPQKSLLCKGHEFKIPDFPLVTENLDNLYLIYDETNCVHNEFSVILGLTPDCKGENFCLVGSFWIDRVSGRTQNLLEQSFSNSSKTVKLTSTSGYFSASTCHAYCTEDYLTWFYNGHLYSIGTKFEKDAKSKLTKAANQYMQNPDR